MECKHSNEDLQIVVVDQWKEAGREILAVDVTCQKCEARFQGAVKKREEQ